MKKSELNKFIREEIISTLSEATEEEVENQVELNKELEKTIKLKDEAGIEEDASDAIDYDTYVDIGKGYLAGFKRPHSLNDDELEVLGRKITKQLYKGSIDAAKKELVKEVKVDIPSPTMLKYNQEVKNVKSAAQAMLDFYNQMQEKEDLLKKLKSKTKLKKELDKILDK